MGRMTMLRPVVMLVQKLREGDYVNGKPLWPWCVQPETRCTVMRESYWHSSSKMIPQAFRKGKGNN